jgi:hypothetical protein
MLSGRLAADRITGPVRARPARRIIAPEGRTA